MQPAPSPPQISGGSQGDADSTPVGCYAQRREAAVPKNRCVSPFFLSRRLHPVAVTLQRYTVQEVVLQDYRIPPKVSLRFRGGKGNGTKMKLSSPHLLIPELQAQLGARCGVQEGHRVGFSVSSSPWG